MMHQRKTLPSWAAEYEEEQKQPSSPHPICRAVDRLLPLSYIKQVSPTLSSDDSQHLISHLQSVVQVLTSTSPLPYPPPSVSPPPSSPLPSIPSLPSLSSSSSTGWSSLPSDLLPVICHHFSSIRDLLHLSSVSSSFILPPSCFSLLPEVIFYLSPTQLIVCDNHDKLFRIVLPLTALFPFPSPLFSRICHSLRFIPSLSLLHHPETYPRAAQLLASHALPSFPHLRQLYLASSYSPPLLSSHLSLLPHLKSVDLEPSPPTSTQSALLTTLHPFCQSQLLHLSVNLSEWDDTPPSLTFPSIISLSVNFFSEGHIDALLPFPSLTALHVSPFSPLPYHLRDFECSIFQQLQFLRHNVATQPAFPHPAPFPLLLALTSLQCLILDTEYHAYDPHDSLATSSLAWDIVHLLSCHLTSVPLACLSQLTIDSTQLTKGMTRGVKRELGRMSGGLSSLPFPPVDFLQLECPDLIDDATIEKLFEDGASVEGKWREGVTSLGMLIDIGQVLTLLSCWNLDGWKKLQRVHIRCQHHLLVRAGPEREVTAQEGRLEGKEKEEKEEEVRQLNLLIRQTVGEKLWVSETQFIGLRADEDFRRKHGIAD